MPRSKTIFLAFAGQSIEQTEPIIEIQDGYECWDLKKFTVDDFVEKLIEKVPPVNKKLLRHYKVDQSSVDMFGITEKQFKECSWGLLIPDSLNDIFVGNYSETLFLLNLYSPTFLYPLFYASDFGISRQSHGRATFEFGHYQNQSSIFKTKEFILFFKMLLPQAQYQGWDLYRAKSWDDEDWRLFVAGFLYSGLKEYDNKKNTFGWQRESADVAAVLEALFTAGDHQNEEVGYRLRKRMAALLAWRFPTIERDVKELYSQRSAFVHGSFFAQIAKDSKRNDNNLPIPDFDLLYKQKEYVRYALVAYLHLAQLIKLPEYTSHETVLAVLEQAVIDIELREKVVKETQLLFSWMPKTNFPAD